MRDIFPYESNVQWIRHLLVPDPVPPDNWEATVLSWRASAAGNSLLEWLITAGIIKESVLLEAVGEAFGVEVLGLGEFEIIPPDSPEEQLLFNNGMIVVRMADGRRLIAGGPDLGPDLGHYLGERAGQWQWVLVSPLRMAPQCAVAEGLAAEPSGYSLAEWLKELVSGLHARGAADIHFERTGSSLSVRMHCGGRMIQAGTWEGEQAHGCLRLLKRWGRLSTAADTMPQDGRIQLQALGEPLTFRISHVMTIDGEGAVLRVLGAERDVRSLPELGMPANLIKVLVDIIQNDPGLLLFSGPTGSGKTTTAYGLLKEIAPLGLKVLTIEDPVEYEMPFAVQTAVNEDTGWTFEAAIRSFLRQDPDVIMLGEMRDHTSAEAACRAALTGHSVIATLHSGDVDSALDRMAGWGIPAGTMAETVRLIINQRLIRDPGTGAMKANFSWKALELEMERAGFTLPGQSNYCHLPCPGPSGRARRP